MRPGHLKAACCTNCACCAMMTAARVGNPCSERSSSSGLQLKSHSLQPAASWLVLSSLKAGYMACAGGSALSMLVLIDRAVDPATPLATQLTYEGTVDEMLGISNGVVSMESSGEPAVTCVW